MFNVDKYTYVKNLDNERNQNKTKKKKANPFKDCKLEMELPRKILVFDNPDKEFHEKYEIGQNPIRFPIPFRASILGNVNSGKSLMAKNIILARQCMSPKFEEIYVVHGCETSHEYDDLEPTEIMKDIPSYLEFDPEIPKLIIIDDYDFTKIDKESLKRLSELFRFGSTHCNFSIILLQQSFFRVPKIVKDMSNVFIIYKPHDIDELKTIGRRVGLKKEQIEPMVDEHIKHHQDSILVNLIPNAPYKFAKNLFIPIQPPSPNHPACDYHSEDASPEDSD